MRDQLNALLARQHELCLKRSASARAEYVKVSIEILALARAWVDLSPNWKPPAAAPARPMISTVADLTEAKSRLARIKEMGGPGWIDDFNQLSNEIRACEGIILERARTKETAA